ncbi:gliding motility-associated C-terminal domain-containing protein [Flavobacterium sp. N1719]|uniref:T9SS type B sorting domain-containing protein n=1 Tax=Flavobacterium sp. N1719 TaxID=2885633 RepID=UPI0022217D04|nr:gliding motility-associated C-terminal domain-containing protein [Flavobacterium sp. N1719]
MPNVCYTRLLLIFFLLGKMYGQNVGLYQQYNGRYDFTFVGNTLNLGENNTTAGCENLIAAASSATLTLSGTQQLHQAFLYWAGSGTGDTSVSLNNQTVTATRLFSNINSSSGLPYFSAFADVTALLQSTGNGIYTLADLDISNELITQPGYCLNRTNFAGWALVIVYSDPTLPINQVNIYDGLQSIPSSININLTNLNVVDNIGAKIGFVAWEGDSNLAVNESLRINGNLLSNPPLNPATNAFNGTNSITGSSTMYNMDLDIYSIQNNIQIGDTSALIQLTSGQDMVLMNVIVTTFNSQLPDAVIQIDSVDQSCDSRDITVHYTVSNPNATDPLPAQTPIAFYIGGTLVGQAQTQTILPINGSETGQITLTIPSTVPDTFTLDAQVDDNGLGQSTVIELIENNNAASFSISLWTSPVVQALAPLVSCNQGITSGQFDFFDYANTAFDASSAQFSGYYESVSDATNQVNAILTPENYWANATPKTIYFRIDNTHCYTIGSFELQTKNCPPTIYNYVSGNGDGANDTFHIDGLYNIFTHFTLEIYNRWGHLVWTGNNNLPEWDGFSIDKNTISDYISPKGTYYYVLKLNDDGYPEPYVGWLYFTF